MIGCSLKREVQTETWPPVMNHTHWSQTATMDGTYMHAAHTASEDAAVKSSGVAVSIAASSISCPLSLRAPQYIRSANTALLAL